MQKKNLAKEIQDRIRGYIEYLIEEESNKRQDEEEFLSYMPENLRKDILIDMNGKLLTENTIFSLNFRPGFLKDLATRLQEKSLGPGDDICFESDPEDMTSFYIITKGRVQLYFQKTNQPLKTLTVGDYFGEASFFSNRKHTSSAKSSNYSHIFYLQKHVFLETLEHYEREKVFFFLLNMQRSNSPFIVGSLLPYS